MDVLGGVGDFFDEVKRKAVGVVSAKPRAFRPIKEGDGKITLDELVYVIEHQLNLGRYFTDEEWEAYPENIRRHFKVFKP